MKVEAYLSTIDLSTPRLIYRGSPGKSPNDLEVEVRVPPEMTGDLWPPKAPMVLEVEVKGLKEVGR